MEKKLKKKTFLNKNGWTAASYDVILETNDTDYHQTCLKTRARDKQTATKNWADVLSSTKKFLKKQGGGGNHPRRLVRLRVKSGFP